MHVQLGKLHVAPPPPLLGLPLDMHTEAGASLTGASLQQLGSLHRKGAMNVLASLVFQCGGHVSSRHGCAFIASAYLPRCG